MPFTVGPLVVNKTLVTVSATDSVRHALDLMNINKFSQLPVVSNERRALGMITSESVLRSIVTFGTTINNMFVDDALKRMRVLDAMDEVNRLYHEDESIFYLIEELKEINAALIVDKEQKLLGIVTSYDTTEFLRIRAEVMMYAEEIETLLKEFINAYFTTSNGLDVQARDAAVSAMYSDKSFDDLSEFNYIRLLLDQSRWERYCTVFSFDRDTIFNLLKDAKDTRNAAAHFHTDEITSEQRRRQKLCRDWLARHSPIISSTLIGVTLEPDEQQNLDIQHTETPASLVEEVNEAEEIALIEEDILTVEDKRLDARYAPLAIWLQKVPITDESISLSFKEIEQIIGDELPASARLYRIWWSNNLKINPHARQWWEAGWRISTIRMAEEIVVFTRIEGRKKAYIDFFSTLLEQLASHQAFQMRNPSPDGESWVIIAGVPTNAPSVAYLGFSFARKKRFRIDMYIDMGKDKEHENKVLFQKLRARKEIIEAELGTSASWEYLEGARGSRIALYHAGAITDPEEELASLRSWAVDSMIRFQKAMDKHVSELA